MPFMIVATAAIAIAGSVMGARAQKKAAAKEDELNRIEYMRSSMNKQAEFEINNILAGAEDQWQAFTSDLGNQRIAKQAEKDTNALMDNIGRVSKELTKGGLQSSLVAAEELGSLMGAAAFNGMSEVTKSQLENTAKLQYLSSDQDIAEKYDDQLSDMAYQNNSIMANALRGFQESPILSNKQVGIESTPMPMAARRPDKGALALDILGTVVGAAGGIYNEMQENKPVVPPRDNVRRGQVGGIRSARNDTLRQTGLRGR